jgi:hypothetical protein
VVYSTVPWLSIGNYSPAKIEVRILELATRRTIIDRKDLTRHDGLLMGDTSQDYRSKQTI